MEAFFRGFHKGFQIFQYKRSFNVLASCWFVDSLFTLRIRVGAAGRREIVDFHRDQIEIELERGGNGALQVAGAGRRAAVQRDEKRVRRIEHAAHSGHHARVQKTVGGNHTGVGRQCATTRKLRAMSTTQASSASQRLLRPKDDRERRSQSRQPR